MKNLYGRKIKVDKDYKYQLLENHIEGVEENILKNTKNFKFSNIAKTIALLHDAGKAKESWQKYLINNSKRENHSNLGMAIIDSLEERKMGKLIQKEKEILKVLSDTIKYVIGAHHGEFDIITEEKGYYYNKIDKRIKEEEKNLNYKQGKQDYFKIVSIKKIEKTFDLAFDEMKNLIEETLKNKKLRRVGLFNFSVLIKMLLSLQIDADWSDASRFEIKKEKEKEENFDWNTLIKEMNDYTSKFKLNSKLNILRTKISDEAFQSSKKETGIYKMNVPTGGGKTYAAMRFALNHSKIHNKDRIFYIAPFISILEQNAEVYRKMFKNNEKYILEHHSNVIFGEEDESEEEIFKYLSSNWSSRIILTSMVQLLNSMFSSNKKSIRRLNKLKNSVIIIDEFQSLPANILAPFNQFINTLSDLHDTTIVLTTATQLPCERILGKDDEKKIPIINYAKEENLVSDYCQYEEFKRVDIIDKMKHQPYSMEEILETLKIEMKKSNSILFILNTRDAVSKVYEEMRNIEKDFKKFMLSNNMVPAHRLEVLKWIKKSLSNNEKIIVISTSLIEAGVDLSVETVIRSIAGLDSIVQSAGRCNRNKEVEKGCVILLNIDKTIENTSKLNLINTQIETTIPIINDFKKNSSKYDNNLLGLKAIEKYYQEYYKKVSSITHGEIKDKDTTIYDLLSDNKYLRKIDKSQKRFEEKRFKFGFKTAGDNFKAIEDLSKDVLVPFREEGKNIINKILSDKYDLKEIRDILKTAQRYTVGIYMNNIKKLQKQKALIFYEDLNIYILKEEFYDYEKGIITERKIKESIIL